MPISFINTLTNSLPAISEYKTVSKNHILTKEGQVERNIYFIEKGAVRAFRITDTEEQTIRLGYEGSFITSLSSLLTQQPSEFYIEAIRKTSMYIINKKQLDELINVNMESVQQYNALLENLIVQQMEREIDLLTASPSERLARVLVRSPNLFQQVPLKYIASYLRMTPETLSRIRNS